MPAFSIVGLPDTAVQEAKDRVRSAIQNSGFPFPKSRITVNLAPADLRKEGPAYDLPIAVGILVASQQAYGDLDRTVFLGELALDGHVRHAQGVLPMVALAKERDMDTIGVPESDKAEAVLIEGVRILPVTSLKELMEHLAGGTPIEPSQFDRSAPDEQELARHGLRRRTRPGTRHAFSRSRRCRWPQCADGRASRRGQDSARPRVARHSPADVAGRGAQRH